MTEICYLNLKQGREVLAGIGVELTPRQIKRAADKDAHGMRKLPFFRCPPAAATEAPVPADADQANSATLG